MDMHDATRIGGALSLAGKSERCNPQLVEAEVTNIIDAFDKREDMPSPAIWRELRRKTRTWPVRELLLHLERVSR